MRDLEAELNSDDGQQSTSWKPNIGDTLVGVLVRMDKGRSDHGDSDIAVIKSDGDATLVGVWLSSKVLTAEFYKAAPVPGDRVAIKRLPDNVGKVYKRYRVLVERATTEAPL